ncbi:MAG UNVERIFIED_CONTAM: hypothetical protein LVT10_11800 [Anaerolineae bacterium]|jgi:hypothetical protein
MFTDAIFYNLGIPAGSMFDAGYFVDQMNERGDYPAVILLCVDLNWFHKIAFDGALYHKQFIGTWKHNLTFAQLLNQTRLFTANLLRR